MNQRIPMQLLSPQRTAHHLAPQHARWPMKGLTMHFTPGMNSTFGEWPGCDRIRCSHDAANPEIDGSTTLDPHPMLRIARTEGDVVVAKADDGDTSSWVVGIATTPALCSVG